MLRVGRNREKHTRMPTGWAPARNGVIYFRPTNAADKAIVKGITGGPMSLRLGATVADAHESDGWRKVLDARKQETDFTPGTVGELVDRARRHYLPKIGNADTRSWRSRHVDALEKAFGSSRYARNASEATRAAPGTFLTALDVQRHLDENAATRPAAANREAKTWGIIFKEARRRWGLTEFNPCAGLDFNPEPPREVLPEDKAIFKVYRKLDPPMRFAVALIRYYGRRRGEILRLQLGDAREDGLHFQRGKARAGRKPKEIVVRWEARLERAWGRLMRWRAARVRGGKVQTTAALVNRLGRRLTVTGFNSAWRRAQDRAKVRGDFTFHDIRAARASTLATAAEAQNVLAHDEARTTTRYRRGPIVVDFTNDSRNSRKRAS